MFFSPLLCLALTSLSSTAHAASDLVVSASSASGVYVYDSSRTTFTVSNTGNQNASNVTLTINLPMTGTTPSYLMGTVGSMSTGCSRSGSVVTCSLGTLRRGRSLSVYVDMTLPYSVDAITFDATAATSSLENSTSNNSVSHDAVLLTYPVSFTGPRDVTNSHCTGTGLVSYYECTLFPSSLSTHDATLNADGSISLPYGAEYGGSWSQPDATTLIMTYTEYGVIIAEFEGQGVGGDCWEGLTTFPGSTYVSMYEVCLQ